MFSYEYSHQEFSLYFVNEYRVLDIIIIYFQLSEDRIISTSWTALISSLYFHYIDL